MVMGKGCEGRNTVGTEHDRNMMGTWQEHGRNTVGTEHDGNMVGTQQVQTLHIIRL